MAMIGRVMLLALVLVVGTGLLISNSITRPIIAIADASAQVALGNLDTRAHQGTDELGVLARTFNQMVDDLRQRTLTDAGCRPRRPRPAVIRSCGTHPRSRHAGDRSQPGSVLAIELRGLDEGGEDAEGARPGFAGMPGNDLDPRDAALGSAGPRRQHDDAGAVRGAYLCPCLPPSRRSRRRTRPSTSRTASRPSMRRAPRTRPWPGAGVPGRGDG